MFIDQSVTQQLAALVAVVSVAILAVAILLVSTAWRGFNQTFKNLINLQKKAIYRFTFLYFGLFLIFLFVTDFVGVYAPDWVQPIGRSLFLLIWVIVFVSFGISAIVKRGDKGKQEPIIESMPQPALLYTITLVWIILCISFCLIALFGVSQTMLNIEIGPYNQDNYNWGVWFLENGILFFIFSVVGLGLTNIIQKIDLSRQITDKPQKRTSVWAYILLFALLLGGLVLSYQALPKEIKKDHSNIVSYFLSAPLTIKTSNGYTGNNFYVTNENNFDWQNITFSINDVGISSGYYFYHDELKQGKSLNIGLTEFTKIDGTRFNISNTKPLTFKIEVYNSLGQSGIYYGTWIK